MTARRAIQPAVEAMRDFGRARVRAQLNELLILVAQERAPDFHALPPDQVGKLTGKQAFDLGHGTACLSLCDRINQALARLDD